MNWVKSGNKSQDKQIMVLWDYRFRHVKDHLKCHCLRLRCEDISSLIITLLSHSLIGTQSCTSDRCAFHSEEKRIFLVDDSKMWPMVSNLRMTTYYCESVLILMHFDWCKSVFGNLTMSEAVERGWPFWFLWYLCLCFHKISRFKVSV